MTFGIIQSWATLIAANAAIRREASESPSGA
jgi:hypothetical protein